MSKILDLDIIGIDSNYSTNIKPVENIILRMDKKYPMAEYYPYLIVSDNIKTLDGKTDLFLIDPFQRKDAIKSKAKRALGVEISIAFAKKLNATMVGKWLKEVKSIYEFCKSNDCQFILSSGASSITELVSARSFESILKLIGVSPKNYWNEITEWLYIKNKVRWVYAKP
ncbi:MAG: hypothetical protein E6K97_01115 [Thaumarchaeota archaeon]|nr:MAG: hypothetical protein E6K97_01115 [Nitrososphaerota archaeon]